MFKEPYVEVVHSFHKHYWYNFELYLLSVNMFYFTFLQAFYFDIIIDSQEIIKIGTEGEPYVYPPLSLPSACVIQNHSTLSEPAN